MSSVFVVIIRDDVIYYGRVHWRKLMAPDITKYLNCTELDGGLVFFDDRTHFLLNLQDCITLGRTSF